MILENRDIISNELLYSLRVNGTIQKYKYLGNAKVRDLMVLATRYIRSQQRAILLEPIVFK